MVQAWSLWQTVITLRYLDAPRPLNITTYFLYWVKYSFRNSLLIFIFKNYVQLASI